jgi:hypothetical protein
MHAAGADPYDITTAVGTLLARAGIATPGALDLVRELSGLGDYDHMAEWQSRYSGEPEEDLAGGIDGPEPPNRPGPRLRL